MLTLNIYSKTLLHIAYYAVLYCIVLATKDRVFWSS
jgi:hypothetical protein